MGQQLELPELANENLCCPICKAKVELAEDSVCCVNPACRSTYPIEQGIPVLINESNSVFSISDFLKHKATFFTPRKKLDALIERMLPTLTFNIKCKRNYSRLAELLLAQSESPTVLVLGGSILGEGMAVLLKSTGIRSVDTDVSFGPRTQIICDAHDIPFADETFDCVVAQAVLEHVVDPRRCVEEIHRVLKPGGYVYAEVPFLYPVHGREYDFTRFTHAGLRRLFNDFSEEESGAQGGPGMALALSWQWFLWSFSSRRSARKLLKAFARLTAWFWKYFDKFLVNRNSALDSASGCYFMGKKTGEHLSDRELIKTYRGGIPG